MKSGLFAALLLSSSAPVFAAESVDRDIVNRIVDAGMNHGQVVETVAYLSDRIGGRMTNSPQMRAAEAWTQEKFKAWGLSNVHPEGFEFGRGWSIDAVAVRMTAPRVLTLRAIPVAWTPATPGAVTAPVIVAPIRRERDFAKWQGKLAGKFVMVSLPNEGSEPDKSVFRRYGDDDLRKLDTYDQPNNVDDDSAARTLKLRLFAAKLDAFLAAEGAKAWVRIARGDGGLLYGEGSGFRAGDVRRVPGIELIAEDYRRLARLAKTDAAPVLEIDSRVRFHDADTKAYNIIADLPGRDAKAGYVMAGAHLDSWVAADGATDNAAGSAVVMEAARILAGLGVKPRRTIRFALWSGEEQGILGSLAYVEQHLATRPAETNADQIKAGPYPSWSRKFPVTPRAGYGELAAYFNLDNGSGKIRGIYAENNAAAVPIFKEWLSPFAGMGATTVASGRTGSTDHVYLQSVGLPAYQFIQDPLDYSGRTHHTNLDTIDHVKAADLRQAAVIMASFLWNAANRDAPLPKMPLPTKPSPTNPFAYPDDDE